MDAIYTLDASYSMVQESQSEVCELAAEIYSEPTGSVFVRWGKFDLTDKFYHIERGRMVKSSESGIYLLLLNDQDEIRQQLFFSANSHSNLAKLGKILEKQAAGQRVLMMSNVDLTLIKASLQGLWPSSLRENYLVYGTTTSNGLQAELADSTLAFERYFIPGSCPQAGTELVVDEGGIKSSVTNTRG